jgi:hypothetical protein
MEFKNNVFNIFINIYVHYPEVYNSTVISNRLNKYFNEYFINNKPLSSEYGKNTHVMFKSAPSNENQMMIIEFEFSNEVDDSINNYLNIEKWEDFLFIYFDKQIIEFKFNFKSL